MAAAAAAAAPCWADLPADLLTSIVQLLELPGALAFATVCASWRSAAAAGGVPPPGTPWLMSWEPDPHPAIGRSRSAVTCKLRPLLDVDKAYSVTFPAGAFVTCCGASDGWLLVVDELCNLSLHNLFTSRTIPLPPVTDFPRVEAEYDDQGRIERYRLTTLYRHSPEVVYDAHHLATFFYRKAVLSGNPSRGGGDGDYVVTVVHYGGEWISYARAGDARWRVLVSNHYWGQNRFNAYAECAYHNGRIYAVKYTGSVERWVFDDAGTPSRKALALRRPRDAVLSRHLVASPGGGLWQVSAVWEPAHAAIPDGVRFTFRVVEDDDAGGGGEERGSMQEHALFLGLNRSACLPAGSFPGVRPGVLYFSAPWMRQYDPENLERVGDWGGARAYDLKARTRTFERVFPGLLPESARLLDCPTEVWITPNLY